MAVKKMRDGIYLYFAHNTESFALSSMTSEDAEPLSVMSRARPNSHSQCTSGGRAMHAAAQGSRTQHSSSNKRQKSVRTPSPATSPSRHFTFEGSADIDGGVNCVQEPQSYQD
jgi:hypothetical protein